MSSTANKTIVGVTVGDPGGIGIETIIKVFHDPRILDSICPVIYGHADAIRTHRKEGKLPEMKYSNISCIDDLKINTVNVLNVWEDKKNIVLGEPNKENGLLSFKALEAAVADLAATKIDVLVTAPINKDSIQSDDFKFPGHTEYLANMSNVEDQLMFLVSDRMRIGVVTGHVPLKDVSSELTKEKIVGKLGIMHESLQKDFATATPTIAVLGLNPHAGDNGLLGSEEKDVILPAIREAQAKGMLVYGPFGADGFFGTSQYSKFDGVLAMYHDQGLAPFKALAFEDGVNFTAGLPIVRTSPDHGTAYDLVGKNLASESSMRNAIFTACDVNKNRQNYKDITANPLQKKSKPKQKIRG